MTRRSLLLVAAIALLICAIGMPLAGQARILFIDQTQTFGTSLRLEVLARRLEASGMFTLSAQLAIPESR